MDKELLDEHWQLDNDKLNAFVKEFIDIKNQIKQLDARKDVIQDILLTVDGINGKVFWDKYIKYSHRYTYKLDWVTEDDAMEVYPEAVKKTIDKEKLFELHPDAIKRSLSRRYTVEKYDPSRHRTEN